MYQLVVAWACMLAPFGARTENHMAEVMEKIPVLLITGVQNHDWQWTSQSLRDMLTSSGKFEVDVTTEPQKTLADTEALRKYKAFVLDYNAGGDARWGEPAESNFLSAVRMGAGVSVIHASNNAFEGWVEYEKLVGLCWREGTGHGAFHEFDVKILDRDHPITRNLPDFKKHPDELYHRLVAMHGVPQRVLATANSTAESGGSGRDEPMIIVKEYGRGRVFHTPLGHVWSGVESSRASHKDLQFQNLVVRGTEWAATGRVTGDPEPGNRITGTEMGEGWRLLFDGRSTRGWRGFRKNLFPSTGWSVEDGALHVKAGGNGGDIITTFAYGDFELELEWKVAAGSNSGVIYRCSEDADTCWQTGPEYQILDDGADKNERNDSAGSLYDLYAPSGKTLKPVGEWNRARIVVNGPHVEHWLNGSKVLEAELGSEDWNQRVGNSKFATMAGFGKQRQGHIALQDHGADVWFRNIRIRELHRPEPAGAAAAEIPLFNGKDLTGWTYHLQNNGKMEDTWSVEDGILICKGNPAGYIRTTEDYTNFVLKLEWRFNPVTKQAGNSGVLVRMIGPDQVWPKSIEAQLLSGYAGDFWNIGEFPMKVATDRTDGRHTSHTHANEKPIGDWNEYEIRVDGGNVTLKVNGQVLNEATDCMEVPGKICLQSEGAEIQFRNIRLAPLATRKSKP